MRRWGIIAAVTTVAFAAAAPAWAAPGFTPPFRVAGAAGNPAMAPDGTVVFPTLATVDAELRVAVQVRPPGGPLADVQLLSAPGSTLGSGFAVDAGGDGRFVGAWIEGGDVKVATLAPGSTSFTPTATLTDDSADGVGVKMDGAGNAYVMWTTRDDVNPGLQRQVRVRLTKFPAGGGAPTTELLETFITPSGVGPTLLVAFDVNDAGDMAFVKSREAYDTGTHITTTQYEGWTRPAGGSDTTMKPLASATHTDSVDTAGEAYLTSLNVGINNAGDIMASWYRGAFPYNTSSVDVVSGTVAAGFGAIEHPPVADVTKLHYSTIPSVLDATGRTTVAASLNIGPNIRVQAFTRSRSGTWAGPQTPLPTGDNNYDPAFAADPSGRVMLVITPSGSGPYTIDTMIAEPGQDFGAPSPLVSDVAGLQRAVPVFGASGDGLLEYVHDENTAQVTDAVGYDVSPPQLRSLTIPTSGMVGSPLDFSVAPLDIWSPVTTTWNFDGVTSDGATQSHLFGDAGSKAVSVTATDTFGNAATANGSVDVAPAPAPSGGGGNTPPPDTTAPSVTGFSFSSAAFAVGKQATPLVAKKVVRGSTLKFSLSEAGVASITIMRELPGRKSGKRCVAPKKGKKGKKCTRLKTMGTLKRTGNAGANKVAFSGRLGKRALGVGRYRATIVVKDAAGNSSKAVVAKFRIVPLR